MAIHVNVTKRFFIQASPSTQYYMAKRLKCFGSGTLPSLQWRLHFIVSALNVQEAGERRLSTKYTSKFKWEVKPYVERSTGQQQLYKKPSLLTFRYCFTSEHGGLQTY